MQIQSRKANKFFEKHYMFWLCVYNEYLDKAILTGQYIVPKKSTNDLSQLAHLTSEVCFAY